MNLCIFSGNVGQDASLRYTANGTAQATFSLAVNNSRKKPDGTWEDNTEWINCVIWGDKADRLSSMILKGTPVLVQGRQQTRSWVDDQGQKHYRTELHCDKVEVFGKRPKSTVADGDDAEDLPWE